MRARIARLTPVRHLGKIITASINILCTLALLLPGLSHSAAPDRSRRGGIPQDRAGEIDRSDELDMIRPSGLQPQYPSQVICPEIASPFGAQTRFDGSRRPAWEFGGYHGGIDISVPEGTPLLSLAAGAVVSKGEGGQLEGNYLWLRHGPEDTGLEYWVYAKYQHLESLPDLPIGARVKRGQAVARSGKTGTTGGHFGASSYPHLHLTTRRSSKDDLNVGSRGSTGGQNLFDPLAIYHDARAMSHDPADSRPDQPTVAIPYVTTDGQVWPQNTRVVWPVACRPR